MTTVVPLEHSSLVGGSTAARRIGCPGSWIREQKAPKSQGSPYAREGTALHEMIAQVLDEGKNPADMLPFTHNQPQKGIEKPWSLTIDEDLWQRLGEPALDMLNDFFDQLEAETDADVNFMIEENGEFPGIPGAFGTSDVIFRCGHIAGIWDWKFGRTLVRAYDNKQLKFYYTVMRERYPEFFEGVTHIKLCISQPQVNETEPEVWDTDNTAIDEFITELQEAIKETQKPDAPINKGTWCAFADCKAICELHVGAAAALGSKMATLEKIKTEGNQSDNLDVGAFLSDAMELAELAAEWAKHIAAITQERVEAMNDVEGWKVVEKRSSGREWTVDEKTVINRMKARGLKADDYYNKKLVTPPQAEKALKKLGKTLPDDCVRVKPSSGFTLTREGDPREAGQSTAAKARNLGEALAQHTGKVIKND